MSYNENQHEIQGKQIPTGKYLTKFQRQLLQENLQKDLSNSYRQRIEIMLLTDEGKSQTEICQIVGCCAATARHWMQIARMGMAHQWQDFRVGRPKAVNEQYLERLKEIVNHNPRDYGYSFRRWTANLLQKHLAKEFGLEISDRHIKRLLKKMGLSTLPKSKNAEAINNAKILIPDLHSIKSTDESDFFDII